VAAIDFGTKRLGLAISDAARSLASPLTGYQRSTPDRDAAWLRQLAQREAIMLFVVGLPVHHSGDESQKSQQARQFGAWLQSVTAIPVVYHDERYSTRQADEWMQLAGLTRKQQAVRRDALAAHAILASYLESGLDGSPPQPLEDA
jgi:putative Holliday junction resolvase